MDTHEVSYMNDTWGYSYVMNSWTCMCVEWLYNYKLTLYTLLTLRIYVWYVYCTYQQWHDIDHVWMLMWIQHMSQLKNTTSLSFRQVKYKHIWYYDIYENSNILMFCNISEHKVQIFEFDVLF